jgi:hypothetical protein
VRDATGFGYETAEVLVDAVGMHTGAEPGPEHIGVVTDGSWRCDASGERDRRSVTNAKPWCCERARFEIDANTRGVDR